VTELELLLHQTQHHYTWVVRATESVDFEHATRTLGTRPSIAWQLGHILVNADSTAESVAELARSEEELGDLPHWGVESAADWDGLRARWLNLSTRALEAYAALAEEDLDRPPATEILEAYEDLLTDRRTFWSGHVFHTAYHLGSIGTLRAEFGLGWWR
jgi:hypothetical protein